MLVRYFEANTLAWIPPMENWTPLAGQGSLLSRSARCY